jgi:hypothetical protein
MTELSHKKALFTHLVYSEDGEQVETTFIGTEPHYVIMDDDFKRHVAAEVVDRQVLELIQGHAEANKEMVSEQIMGMIGKDDLFTKAMIDSPEDARTMLGMMGFRIVVNVHGEVVDVQMPGVEAPDDGDWE